jgi:hypothetical protein
MIAEAFAVSVFAGESVFGRLANMKSLRCTFGPGTYGDWKGGNLKIGKNSLGTLQFDSIDVKTNTARMIGNVAAGNVTVFLTPAGLTFVEQTDSGNMIFSTVFASYKKNTTDFIAVTSRHIDMLDGPLPSQYHGSCKAWE